MRFFIQQATTDKPHLRALASTLHEQYAQLDFISPDHLRSTLRDQIAANKLPLTVGQVAGTIVVSAPEGIILKFRTPD